MIKWAWPSLCRAARAALAFLLDLAQCTRIHAGVYEWQIAVWYPNNVIGGILSWVTGARWKLQARPPPPLVSHDRLVLISGEKQRCKVIKERKRGLLLNRFSFFVSGFLSSQAKTRRLDSDDFCCLLCAAAFFFFFLFLRCQVWLIKLLFWKQSAHLRTVWWVCQCFNGFRIANCFYVWDTASIA